MNRKSLTEILEIIAHIKEDWDHIESAVQVLEELEEKLLDVEID